MNFLTSLKVFLCLMFLIIPIFGAFSRSGDNGVKCLERERLVLVKFKGELIDDYGRLSTWANEGDCCKWEGIVCDNQTNHVITVDLQGPQYPNTKAPLRGKISPSLLELANLKYLDLSFNDFNNSQIPDFIGSLGNLQHLSLFSSKFSGLIPHSLGNLSMLRHLDLGVNSLIDTNLDWLFGIRSLEYLDLSGANLQGAATSLQVINELTKLKEIHLVSCVLSTTLPTIFPSINASSTSLVVLDLSNNSLEGRIPDSLGNLTSLSFLELSSNDLHGRIPNAFGNLMSLVELHLWRNNLEGNNIPDALRNLTGLSHLDLSYNQLQGEFPLPSRESLIQGINYLWFPNLEYLDLSGNKFTGWVPDLSSCLSLTRLYITETMFNGIVIESVGYLSNLQHLDLSSNHLEGLISEVHLFNLSKLDYLDLSFNSNLTVRISSSWNPPFQLSDLYLAHCDLGPYFPKWLRKQKQLKSLYISDAKISDAIPYWFWDTIQECQFLNISHNQIHGVLPDLSSNLSLIQIDFNSNEFNGSVPLLPPSLGFIDLSRNKFSGSVINFCNNSNLAFLDLSENLFSMEIPQDCFRKLMILNYLNLASNNFSGELPNSNDFVCHAFSLHLRNNSFTGAISRSLKNCHQLNILDLGGSIPNWLGESMPNLVVLSLRSNKLYGSLPPSLCCLAKLQLLDISMNDISGTITKCLKNFTMLSSKLDSNSIDFRFIKKSFFAGGYDSAYVIWKGKEAQYTSTLRLLTVIDLSSNQLTGEIPPQVTSLVGLVALNLSRNKLVGSIPYDIGKLELLNFLDLSNNNLSGHIPPSLSQLNYVGVLDLSYNNLSGKIPWDAHLQTFSDSTFIGNPELCGPPLVSKPCPEDRLPKTPPEFANTLVHEDTFISMGFYISMIFGFIVAFWGVVLTVFLNKWCRIIFHKMVINIIDWLYDKDFLS